MTDKTAALAEKPKSVLYNHTISSPGFRALLLALFMGGMLDNMFTLMTQLLVIKQVNIHDAAFLNYILLKVAFVLPYLLFPQIAGFLADRYKKHLVLRYTKMMELFTMSLAFYFLMHESQIGLLCTLFLLGTQATLFSPAKYGIIPEIIETKDISRGNGYVEFWTFIAILAGTAIGGVVLKLGATHPMIPGASLLFVSSIGVAASFFVSRTDIEDRSTKLDPNPLQPLRVLREIKKDRWLFLTVLAIAYLWSIGALFQLNVVVFGSEVMHLDELRISLLFAGLGLGIGYGSLAAGRLSQGKVELGLVPLGAIGMTIASIGMAFSGSSYSAAFACLVLMGLSSGYFIVPLNSFLQERSPVDRRGQYISCSNFATFVGVIGSSFLLYFLIVGLGLSPDKVFLVAGIITLGVSVYICATLPEMLIRCVNWILAHTFYRLSVNGLENVPKSGGALLVCNHTSYSDVSLLLASIDRPIRFLIYRSIYEKKFLHSIVKTMKSIPVGSEDGPKALVEAFNQAREAIAAGELVLIFAEGSLTRIGRIIPFSRGLERIMKGLNAPIIPVFMDQVWGSIFSFRGGKYFWKMPRQIPYPVDVTFGEPVPPQTTAREMRLLIQELSSTAKSRRLADGESLGRRFLRTARRNFSKTAMTDSAGKKISFGQYGGLSLSLARVLKLKFGDPANSNQASTALAELGRPAIGIYLPPSAIGAITNMAATLGGFVTVNLNYTTGPESMQSAIDQSGLTTILTTKRFLDRLKVEQSPNMVLVEDLLAGIGAVKFLWAAGLLIMPRRLLSKFFDTVGPNDVATVIFSSGSTGEPKGVKLTHVNIISNIEGVVEVFQIDRRDCILGVLPFFHSLGFTATLWLPATSGIRVAYHPDPTDAGAISELLKTSAVTIILATPTFLMLYLRKCAAEDFAAVRQVMCGAEKLKASLAEAFNEKFGIVPMEGYGATELSPVVSLNVPDFKSERIFQVGYKPGSVGHPLPGTVAEIVDPETGDRLPEGSEGLLLIGGPNVMAGYLGNPQKTAEVIRNGRYVTGDIAKIDEDGFITITDRMSRFSKIGGEMIPHIKVEEQILQAIGSAQQVAVVTAVPDDKKGERLIVLHTVDLNPAQIAKQLSEAGLPNLWIPKPDSYFRIEQLPVLGSGKLDLKGIKQIARERAQAAKSGAAGSSASGPAAGNS